MSNDTLITGKCKCRFSAALSSRCQIGTAPIIRVADHQCPDDRCPAVPHTSSAHPVPSNAPTCAQQCTHLCPAMHPPVPSSASTCAQQCTHLCP
ncbi:unnamed protein product, partial [Staurois parvus]